MALSDTLASFEGTGMFRRGGDAAATAAVAPAPERTRSEKRSNRYAGPCRLCTSTVSEGSGYLGPKVDGKWTVEHLPGDCVSVPTDTPAEDHVHGVEDYLEPIWPGIYTIQHANGSHRTLRVVVKKHDSQFAPGATVVEYLFGRDNDNDYKGFAFVKGGKLQVWQRFRSGHGDLVADAQLIVDHPEALQEAFTSGEAVQVEGATILASKNCLRCGATLSKPESIAAGIGPECIKKGW